MALEREILEKFHQLPAEKQQELLDFAEFLAEKSGQKGEAWLPGFFDEVLGGWAGEPLQRSPQGVVEQRDKWS